MLLLLWLLSVDKLVTDHLPHICILLSFSQKVLGQIYQCLWINTIAPSDHFQQIQISAELNW